MKNVLTNGVRDVFYNSKFVILFWSFNAVVALVLTAPIYNILFDSLGRSLLSDKLAHGFDYTWFVQFQNIYRLEIEQMPMSIYFLVGFYALIQTFFMGGLISIFNTPKKNHFVDFFYGGVKYFYRFTKVLLVSLVFFALAFKINDWLGNLVSLFFKNSEDVMGEFILRSLRYILLIFLIGITTLISDYSKVALAIYDRTKVIKEIYKTIVFLRKNFNNVFIIFLVVAVLGAIGVIIYNLVGKEIPRTPFYFLILLFVLQQMLIIFRLYIRMLFCSTEVSLYKDLSAEQIPVEPGGE